MVDIVLQKKRFREIPYKNKVKVKEHDILTIIMQLTNRSSQQTPHPNEAVRREI